MVRTFIQSQIHSKTQVELTFQTFSQEAGKSQLVLLFQKVCDIFFHDLSLNPDYLGLSWTRPKMEHLGIS